jgi:hypothetical protein
VPGVQASSGEIKRRLDDTQRAEVDRHLKEGRSVALYADERGIPSLVVTYGNRSADLPNQYPPSHYGRGELVAYVPAPREARPMVSPLLGWEQPQQIARPKVMPGFTETPDVRINMREGPHPRAHSEFLNAQRNLPGREPEPEPQEPAAPLTSAQAFWVKAVSGQ